MNNCLISRLFGFGASSGGNPSGGNGRIRMVDPATVQSWLAEGGAVIVDVREPNEHRAARIPGAVLVPLSRFDPAQVPNNEGKRLVFHCQSGRRCGPAAEKMMAAGFQGEIYRLDGGFGAWAAASGPVERG